MLTSLPWPRPPAQRVAEHYHELDTKSGNFPGGRSSAAPLGIRLGGLKPKAMRSPIQPPLGIFISIPVGCSTLNPTSRTSLPPCLVFRVEVRFSRLGVLGFGLKARASKIKSIGFRMRY